MALRYALLATLNETPATGYDVTQRFRERLANVWPASHQQIYKELGRLHDEGLVSMQALPQAGKPDRKRYAVTDAGVAALISWLQQPQPFPPVRSPMLVKLFAGDLLDDAALAREIDHARSQWQPTLNRYREIEQAYFNEPGRLPRHFRLQHLALRRGIVAVEAALDWLDELEAFAAAADSD